jgi:hypothetical protein
MKNNHSAAGVNTLALLAVAGSLVFVGGCASTPVPNEQMAVSEAALARASTDSTRASAGAELRTAELKMAGARAAVAAGDMEKARRLAEQTEVDAQLAEVHAQSVGLRQAAAESNDAARVLREEINRKPAR